jgi:hypothetical protein
MNSFSLTSATYFAQAAERPYGVLRGGLDVMSQENCKVSSFAEGHMLASTGDEDYDWESEVERLWLRLSKI